LGVCVPPINGVTPSSPFFLFASRRTILGLSGTATSPPLFFTTLVQKAVLWSFVSADSSWWPRCARQRGGGPVLCPRVPLAQLWYNIFPQTPFVFLTGKQFFHIFRRRFFPSVFSTQEERPLFFSNRGQCHCVPFRRYGVGPVQPLRRFSAFGRRNPRISNVSLATCTGGAVFFLHD